MEPKYTYHANAQWHQDGRQFVELDHGAPRTINFSVPPEFGGESGFWTPEHFLLASVATCFVATFKGMSKASKLDFQGIEVDVDGIIEKDGGSLRFTRIVLRPIVIGYHEEDRERIARLLEKAERGCLIARSLSSTIELESKILVEKLVTA
jgi:peroxiredoxin-like protein